MKSKTASIIFGGELSKFSRQYFVEVLAIFVVNKATQVFAFRTGDTDPVIYKEVQIASESEESRHHSYLEGNNFPYLFSPFHSQILISLEGSSCQSDAFALSECMGFRWDFIPDATIENSTIRISLQISKDRDFLAFVLMNFLTAVRTEILQKILATVYDSKTPLIPILNADYEKHKRKHKLP
uniref:Uncharacterized protein n=1 Tax=Romanomermis culicivorax TaxID=13658 RepID=A0A915K8G7_ROMCU